MISIHDSVVYGSIFRLFTTIFLLGYIKNSISKEYLYLIIPIVLIFLDNLDRVFMDLSYPTAKIIFEGEDYNFKDKLNDLFAYYFTWGILGMDNIYLYLTIYRTIGVLMYMKYGNGKIFIAFPDVFKELMVYQHFMKGDNSYLPILIGGKMMVEYYMHHNKKRK